MCPIKVTIGARVSSALSLRLANDIYHKARHFFLSYRFSRNRGQGRMSRRLSIFTREWWTGGCTSSVHKHRHSVSGVQLSRAY